MLAKLICVDVLALVPLILVGVAVLRHIYTDGEVVEKGTSNTGPAHQFGATNQRDFTYGIGKVDGEFILILTPARWTLMT